MKKGLVTGTFDPITIGHIDLIKRAAKLCDELIVGVFENHSKTSMFDLDQRMEMAKAATADLKNVSVVKCDGHLATYVLENGFDVMIRGLRNGSDFEYELPLAQQYDNFFKDKVETIYLMTEPSVSYISSTIVRENFLCGADVSNWVPEKVLQLMKKYKE